jgi:hypothetical protein
MRKGGAKGNAEKIHMKNTKYYHTLTANGNLISCFSFCVLLSLSTFMSLYSSCSSTSDAVEIGRKAETLEILTDRQPITTKELHELLQAPFKPEECVVMISFNEASAGPDAEALLVYGD